MVGPCPLCCDSLVPRLAFLQTVPSSVQSLQNRNTPEDFEYNIDTNKNDAAVPGQNKVGVTRAVFPMPINKHALVQATQRASGFLKVLKNK